MVEGIVIMLSMFVMFGMNLYAVKAYGGKVDQMSSTRRDVLYFASHACDPGRQNSSDQDTYTDQALAGLAGAAINGESSDFPPQDPNDPNSTTTGAQHIDSQVGGGLNASVQKDWNSASGGKSATVYGQAAATDGNHLVPQKFNPAATIITNSYATCNEKRYDNDWTALLNYGWSWLQSAGGGL
jgi:hypothetical protein